MAEQSGTCTFPGALNGPTINPDPCPKGPRTYCSGGDDRGQTDVSHLRQLPKVRIACKVDLYLYFPATSPLLRDLINSSVTLGSRFRLPPRTKAFEFYSKRTLVQRVPGPIVLEAKTEDRQTCLTYVNCRRLGKPVSRPILVLPCYIAAVARPH